LLIIVAALYFLRTCTKKTGKKSNTINAPTAGGDGSPSAVEIAYTGKTPGGPVKTEVSEKTKRWIDDSPAGPVGLAGEEKVSIHHNKHTSGSAVTESSVKRFSLAAVMNSPKKVSLGFVSMLSPKKLRRTNQDDGEQPSSPLMGKKAQEEDHIRVTSLSNVELNDQ